MPRKRRRARRGSRPAKITEIRRGGSKTLRVQVYNPLANDGSGGWVSACSVIGIPARTFDTQTEAREIADRAEALLARRSGSEITVAQLCERWLARRTDVRGNPVKDSTHVTNEGRVRGLVAAFGDDDPYAVEAEMLAYVRAQGAAVRMAVKALFNWAEAEEILAENPMTKLKVRRGNGNEETFPPTAEEIARLHAQAVKVSPDFADWLLFGRTVGTRPGETDAVRFDDFNLDCTRVTILRQFNHHTQRIETPKRKRNYQVFVPDETAKMVRARRARYGHDGGYVFRNTRGDHWRSGSRSYYWRAAMNAAGFRRRVGEKWIADFTPYLATRHYCGHFLVNACRLSSEAVAMQLRHDDHGDLVRKLYGKRDRHMAIEEVAEHVAEQDRQARTTRLRLIEGDQ
jgi:integrase